MVATATKKRRKRSFKDADAIREELERFDAEDVSDFELKERYVSTHLWEYFKPFGWQDKVSDAAKNNLIILVPAPNGIGKTAELACLALSWLMGYEAWNEVRADYPDAFKVGGKYYKPSSLGKKPPIRLRLTGEDWNHHLGQTVVPELKKWAPVGQYETRKNSNSVEYFWTFKNGSTLELMTHDQEIKLFEGWRGDGWLADEPPPYAVFKAMARGLAERHGIVGLFCTPLKEAWMLDVLMLSSRTDIYVFKNLTLYENEMSFENDNKILEELGLNGRVTRYWSESDGQKKQFFNLILDVDDKGVAAEKYLRETANSIIDIDRKIMQLIFLRKAKDTDIEEKPTRFRGTFKKLLGLVIKNYDKQKHVIEHFETPTDSIVTVFIDFHLHKPHAISFYECDKRNTHYVIDEVWENMCAEEIADLIIRKKKINCWRIDEVFIDPLSKGDEKYMKNRDPNAVDSFTIIEEKLDVHDIELIVASKDKVSGFSNIRTWLEGVNRMPTLFFLDSLPSVKDEAQYGHVYEIQRLSYVEDSDDGKIEKVRDDFMENLYRYTLAGIEYKEKKEEDMAVVGSGKESWMG